MERGELWAYGFCSPSVPLLLDFGCIVLSCFASYLYREISPWLLVIIIYKGKFQPSRYHRNLKVFHCSQEKKKKSRKYQFQKGAFQVAYIISLNFLILKTTITQVIDVICLFFPSTVPSRILPLYP